MHEIRLSVYIVTVVIVAGLNWSGHNFTLEQKDSGSANSYPQAANRTVPNGMKDYNHPVCDMLEKNAHLCSVLNAPLPNSAILLQSNRLPMANSNLFKPSITERRVTGGSYLPHAAQQQCRTFNHGAHQACCGVYTTVPVTVAGNLTAAGGYCDSNISVRGCRPAINGMLVNCAETRNGYCTNTAGPGMVVGQPVPCRSYAPAMRWSVAPTTSSVNSEFVCKMNGFADITASSAERTNVNATNLHLPAVTVSTVDSLQGENVPVAYH